VCGREGTLQNIKVDCLVFNERRVIRKAKVNQDLRGDNECEARTDFRKVRCRKLTSSVGREFAECGAKEDGCRSIMLEVVKSPCMMSAWCILAISAPINSINVSAGTFSQSLDMAGHALKIRTLGDAKFRQGISVLVLLGLIVGVFAKLLFLGSSR
jgi:hypothetical protein